jgi:hypothetical protein
MNARACLKAIFSHALAFLAPPNILLKTFQEMNLLPNTGILKQDNSTMPDKNIIATRFRLLEKL